MNGNALQHIGEPYLGIELVHFAAAHKRINHRCPPGTLMAAGE
jgi:hypothetical protein